MYHRQTLLSHCTLHLHLQCSANIILPSLPTVASGTHRSFGSWGYSSPRVSFMLFNSVWTLLVLLYVALTPLYLASLHHKLAATVITTITAIFWFAGSIALAVVSGGGVVAAAVAFGFFLW